MQQLENIVKAVQADEEFVVATVVEAQGSTPGRAGFRMVVHADRITGTIGGGALENTVVEAARRMLDERREAGLLRLELAELGMQCGGQVQVFLEPHYRRAPLWIFGAGHIAMALTPILSAVGFRVTVVDNRPGFAVPGRFPADTTLVTGNYLEEVTRIPRDAYAVIVTHGHAHDEEILSTLVSQQPPLPYIGMIGSRRKVLVVRKKLQEAGKPCTNVYSPIGLDIGGDSPAEIALAIAAEVQGLLYKKTGLPHCRLAD